MRWAYPEDWPTAGDDLLAVGVESPPAGVDLLAAGVEFAPAGVEAE